MQRVLRKIVLFLKGSRWSVWNNLTSIHSKKAPSAGYLVELRSLEVHVCKCQMNPAGAVENISNGKRATGLV
jgi:hypothetical protein